MNAVLMFGWSTAVIFEVLRRVVIRRRGRERWFKRERMNDKP